MWIVGLFYLSRFNNDMILGLIGRKLAGELTREDTVLLESLVKDNSLMMQCYNMVSSTWNPAEEDRMASEEAFRKLWEKVKVSSMCDGEKGRNSYRKIDNEEV